MEVSTASLSVQLPDLVRWQQCHKLKLYETTNTTCQHFPGCMSICSAAVHAYRCQDCASVACHGIKIGRFVGIGVLVVCYNLIHQPVGACSHVWCQGCAVYSVSTCAASHAGVCCNSPCHTGLMLCCSQHLKCIAGCLIPVGVANMEIEAINELW